MCAYLSTTDQLLAIQGSKAPHLAQHSLQVASIAVEIGRACGLDAATIQDLHVASLLHDCGMTSLPLALLGQKRTLRWMERAQLNTHVIRGSEWFRSAPELESIRWAVQHHHERWDGHGYPQRLAGDDIPLLARIISIAEALVSMVSNHAYRAAWSPQAALDEIVRCAGSQFDPNIVDVIAESNELVALRTPAWPGPATVALAS